MGVAIPKASMALFTASCACFASLPMPTIASTSCAATGSAGWASAWLPVALLDYGDFKAMSIAAKDCDAPSYQIVQGTAGYIRVDGKPNGLGTVELCLHDGSVQTYVPPEQDQYQGEFEALRTFAEGGERGLEECWRMAELGLVVSRVQTQARASAGIVFAADAH